MKTTCFLIFSCLLLTSGLSFAGRETVRSSYFPGTAWAKEEEKTPVTGLKPPVHTLSASRLKCEILSYAKGVFLARLGFAGMPKPPEILVKVQHACFVTFFSGKRVIACFGNFYPRTGNVADEIAENIRMALISDSRARYIDRKMAMAADVQITFPGEPCAVTSYAEVNPLREGLLVENERDGVAIVPGEAKTASWAFREAMRRLGDKNLSRVRIFKFQAFAVSSRR